jgi:hypothetical protein
MRILLLILLILAAVSLGVLFHPLFLILLVLCVLLLAY